jgi:hypothetical protein
MFPTLTARISKSASPEDKGPTRHTFGAALERGIRACAAPALRMRSMRDMRDVSASREAGEEESVWEEEAKRRAAGTNMTGRPLSIIVHSIYGIVSE